MKVFHTKHGFWCLLSQILYSVVLLLLCLLRMYWKLPLANQSIALIGMGAAFLWPAVSLITGVASMVFSVLAWRNRESVVRNACILIVAILLMVLSIIFAKELMQNIFYG